MATESTEEHGKIKAFFLLANFLRAMIFQQTVTLSCLVPFLQDFSVFFSGFRGH